MSSNPTEPSGQSQTPGPAAPATGRDRRVSIVREHGGGEAHYGLFHAHGITPEGAFLAGSLFLELGEEVQLSLPLGEANEIRTQARVVALDVGPTPGMHVIFPALEPRDRALIEEHRSHGAEPRGGAHG